jgi:nucleotide-binding universal stress UspA family protein
LTTILATLDGSTESHGILPVLQEVAVAMKATVRLLTVVRPAEATYGQPSVPGIGISEARAVGPGTSDPALPRTGAPGEPRFGESREQAIARVDHVALERLDITARPLRDAGLTVIPAVVMSEDVAASIIAAAREHKVDMIAMATHGRSGIRAIVQGSVAAEVLRSGVAPMLMVRPS